MADVVTRQGCLRSGDQENLEICGLVSDNLRDNVASIQEVAENAPPFSSGKLQAMPNGKQSNLIILFSLLVSDQ